MTDDNLQDFVKKAIFPPPPVDLHRTRWTRARPLHRGKVFVVITIRGSRGQVFRLSRDFINYGQKVCLRRNEVWIRRGATTDLATPEEIARILTGLSPSPTSRSAELNPHRQSFAKRSLVSQRRVIDVATITTLRSTGYRLLPRSNKPGAQPFDRGGLEVPTLWKRIGSTVFLIHVLSCVQGIRWQDLRVYELYRLFPDDLATWEDLPTPITSLTRRRVKRVRRLAVLPVLTNVPDARVRRALPELRWLGRFRWYFRPYLRSMNPRYNRPDLVELPSSSELLLLTPIHSVEEVEDSLGAAIGAVEATDEDTVAVPQRDWASQARR